jgi:hypothetical protein
VGVQGWLRHPHQLSLCSTRGAGPLSADAPSFHAKSAATLLGSGAALGVDLCRRVAPPPPPAHSSAPTSAVYANALEVYHTSLSLTAEQQTIALYWADNAGATGTPSGHWMAIVGQMARNHGLSLMAAAEAYVWVGLAVAGASISCWQTKYT